MKIEDLQKNMNKLMQEQNNRPIPEFEGYSPYDMLHIIHHTFASESPLQWNKLLDADYQKIPILNLVKYLMALIHEGGEIKLTKKGFLPVKIVADMYQQGFYLDERVERKISKLYKETDSRPSI